MPTFEIGIMADYRKYNLFAKNKVLAILTERKDVMFIIIIIMFDLDFFQKSKKILLKCTVATKNSTALTKKHGILLILICCLFGKTFNFNAEVSM